MLRLAGLDHVQLAMPAGGEDEARRFYGTVLGLREVPKPEPLATRGGCWFAGPGIQVHLGVEEPFRPAAKAHPGLLVEDLDAARAALQAAGVGIREDDVDLGVRRFYATDPFGNRLELIDARDAGFTERGDDGLGGRGGRHVGPRDTP